VASATQTHSSPAETPQPGRRTRRWSFVRGRLWSFVELFTLTGFVVAQPLLDVIGRSPDFLLFRQADTRDIALLAVTITLLPPLALWALELLAGLLGREVQRVVHRRGNHRPRRQGVGVGPLASGDKTWVRRPASFQGFLSALRPTAKPSVHFLHILLPTRRGSTCPLG
jgi:hypothetical protein